MPKKRSLNHQVVDALNAITRIGESRHQAKIDGTADRLLFSFQGRKTYQQRCITAVTWMQQQRPAIAQLRDITHADIAAYFANCTQREIVSTRTIRAALHKLEHGMRALRWWSNPDPWMPDITISTPRTRGSRFAWSPQTCQELLDHLGGEARLAADIAWNSGLRLSEIVRLRATDIDRINNTIRVRNGKGGQARIVTLLRDPDLLDRIPTTNDSIFDWHGRTQTSIERAIEATITDARRALELPDDGRNIHAFRSAYASYWLDQWVTTDLDGTGLRIDEDSARLRIAEQLGHHRIDVTYRYVTRITPPTRRR